MAELKLKPSPATGLKFLGNLIWLPSEDYFLRNHGPLKLRMCFAGAEVQANSGNAVPCNRGRGTSGPLKEPRALGQGRFRWMAVEEGGSGNQGTLGPRGSRSCPHPQIP